MKKSNFITFLSLFLLIVAVVLFMILGKTKTPEYEKENNSSSSTTTSTTAPSSTKTSTDSETSVPEAVDFSMENALFIGDSRTVGLMEYAGIDEADFFCNVGMSVYNIHKKPVSVPTVGKVTLTQLLENKKYDKIYVMLGVNEIGYDTKSTVTKYSELIDFIKDKQPDAVVFIQANLHVTASRSDSDKIVNNKAIDNFNNEISKLADGKENFYLDINPVFDDNTGNLSKDKSEDSTHLYAKYYKEWGKWIIGKTASILKEG